MRDIRVTAHCIVEGRINMKFNKNDLNKPWLAYSAATCSAVVLFIFLSNLDFWGKVALQIGEFIYPIFLAAVIAFILNPLVELFVKYVFADVRSDSLRRTLSVFCTIVSVFLVIAILLFALVPQVVASITTFAGNFDTYMNSVRSFLDYLSSTTIAQQLDMTELINTGGSFLGSISSVVPKSLTGILSKSLSFTKSVMEAVIAFILSIYFLGAKDNLLKGFRFLLQALLSDTAYPSTVSFLKRCHDIFIRYFAFDLLDGFIIGIANWIFMVIFHMPYVALLSVIVGITNLAPTFGPIIGAIIGSLILVLVNPWYVVWFLIFTAILQTIDAYIIKPRLFGDSLGVPPVLLMVSIIVFGRIFGVVGVLLSIPLAAIWDYIYRTWLFGMLEKSRDAHERDHEEHLLHSRQGKVRGAPVEDNAPEKPAAQGDDPIEDTDAQGNDPVTKKAPGSNGVPPEEPPS